MKYSKPSLAKLVASLLLIGLAGCASNQTERKLTMPSWVDLDQEEQTEAQADYDAENAADAGDRITQEQPQDQEAPLPDEAPSPESQAETTTTDEAPGQSETQTADTQEQAPAVKRPPQPKPLTAKNEQQALQAQQAQPHYQQALAKMKAGDHQAALLLFQELSAQYPDLTGPIVNQAIILREQENYNQALQVLKKALFNKSQNPYLMNELGLVYRKLGKFEAAKQAYLSAIRIEPNYDKAHYNLGVLADLYLHDPALALAEFEAYQALQAEPDKKVAVWLKEIERRIP